MVPEEKRRGQFQPESTPAPLPPHPVSKTESQPSQGREVSLLLTNSTRRTQRVPTGARSHNCLPTSREWLSAGFPLQRLPVSLSSLTLAGWFVVSSSPPDADMPASLSKAASLTPASNLKVCLRGPHPLYSLSARLLTQFLCLICRQLACLDGVCDRFTKPH